jgi:isochorismate synthase
MENPGKTGFYINPTIIGHLFEFAISNNFAIALWKQPGNDAFGVIIGQLHHTDLKNAGNHSFCIVPFDKSCFYAIHPDIFISENKLHYISENSLILGLFENLLSQNFHPEKKLDKINWHCLADDDTEDESKEKYLEQIRISLEEVENQQFEKVVSARKKTILLPSDFSPVKLFLKLINENTSAFTSLISSPETGTWIGASPELLLKYESRELETMALAGTRSNQQIEENDLFNEKEKYEQLLVVKFIRDLLTAKGIQFKEFATEIAEAAKLFHIKTLFRANTNDHADIIDLLESLHPTPAVCGYPRDESFNFIIKNENLPRKLFSGYLGPFHNAEKFTFYVNIRCMEIRRTTGILYAGAGILKDSNPEKEWYETENKMRTLLNLIN